MKTFTRLALSAASLALIGFGVATTSLAQPGGASLPGYVAGSEGPGAQGPGARGGDQGRPMMDPALRQQRMQQRAERRAGQLRAVLQLRADQEPALQAFLTALRPPQDMGGHRMGGHRMGGEGMDPMASMTTPQRLDMMAQRMEQHQRMAQTRAAATRRFYAQLSPTQQAAFDALPMRPGMGGPRGGHRGRGGPGMGGPGMGGPGMGGPGMGGPRG